MWLAAEREEASREGIEMRGTGYSLSPLRGNNYTARVRIKYFPCTAEFAMYLAGRSHLRMIIDAIAARVL